jgi:hypothetical protein
MNLVINSEDLSVKNIFFNDSIKNNVMHDSSFIRILYSNKDFVLNGISIKLTIVKENTQKNLLHNKCNEYPNNIKNINYIDDLEKYILNTYNNKKLHSYKIKEQIQYLIYKLSNNINHIHHSIDPVVYILKISGIWETQSTIGITNKFISI